MSVYVIVVGAGNIGSQLVELAVEHGYEVVVVEHDGAVAERIGRRYDCMVINADATSATTLEEAGADRADAIISTTDQDATNIMVMLLAEELGIPSRVSVVHNPDHMALFRRSGANVIENPQKLISEYLLRAVQRPSVKDFMHLAGDAEVFEITVTDEASIDGMTISEADDAGMLATDTLVVAVERGEDVITPKGDVRVEAGDLVTVFSKRGFAPDVVEPFVGPEQVADDAGGSGIGGLLGG